MPNTDTKPASDKEQTQAPQIPPHTTSYTHQTQDDTIDLYELWVTLLDKKWIVIAVTAISALGSTVYALRQPHVYRAEALLLPPKAKYIQSLNQLQEAEGKQALDLNIVYSAFKKNLHSRSLQKKFIEEQGLMDILAPDRTPETRDIDILVSFSKLIKVVNRENMSVSMESNDPKFAAKLINDYIDYFDIETIRELSANARSTIARRVRHIENTIFSKQQMEKVRQEDEIKELEKAISSRQKMAKMRRDDKIKELENTISIKREMAKIIREDKIKLYEEAAVIASNLGFKDRVGTTNIDYIVHNTREIPSSTLDTQNLSSTPLYYRGSRALNAEIEYLKNRKSDDPYIPNLRNWQEKLKRLHLSENVLPDYEINSLKYGWRDLQTKLDQLRSRKSDYTFFQGLRLLQEKLTLLRTIKIDEEGQHSVTIDQAAYPPKYRIKPKRRLIVSIGTVAGLFSGIFLVFIISFIERQKKIHSA